MTDRTVGQHVVGVLALVATALGVAELLVGELSPLLDPATTALWGVVVALWLGPSVLRRAGVREDGARRF